MSLNQSRVKSRKVLRKEARKAKKQRRHEYYARRGKQKVEETVKTNAKKDNSIKDKSKKGDMFKNLREEQVHEMKQEKSQKKILDEEIRKKRVKRLMEDNLREEKEITKLEKQLKFRKGKRSGAFTLDGLDFLLDFCDKKVGNNKRDIAFEESDNEFQDDLATISGSKKKGIVKKIQDDIDDSDMQSVDSDLDIESNYEEDEDLVLPKKKQCRNSEISSNNKKKVKFLAEKDESDEVEDMEENYEEFSDMDSFGEGGTESNEEIKEPPKSSKTQFKDVKKNVEKKKVSHIDLKGKEGMQSNQKEFISKKKKNKAKLNKKHVEVISKQSDFSAESDTDNNETEKSDKTQDMGSKDSGKWEDIYGRTRDKDGNIIKTYKPPHSRKVQTIGEVGMNKEKLMRLRRQLKGLLNRLAENNMASISSQIEQLYMSHSRNEMNETLKDLFIESIVTEVSTPERLIAEHAMLVAILHANIGSEIGAHFLQFSVIEFNKLLKDEIPVEDKHINNLLLFIMYLYNFQIFHSKLMYDLINELLKNLKEKQIELLLTVLRTVGFSLRKDDPSALKAVVLKIQERASALGNNDENYTRMKYMLEVVSAIKNNNVSKIPNYNPDLVEHLKKCMRVLIRKGNYSTELNISLQDLLNAEEHGRWWVVGSAWSGSGPTENKLKFDESKEIKSNQVSFSQKLFDLAKKQRMNTEVRRTIFCTLMTAEDYLDAFEKLMKLGLKGAVEKEIINVLIHCSLQEKDFNPYYFHLANKLCVFDRKYQIMIQYSSWDKIKELNNMLSIQVTNLAKLLGNIIASRGLPLSVLKIIQFSELDKVAVKFVRQVLLTIFLTDEETVASVFSRIISSSKLKIFRDGIRLFIHHFMIKNIKVNPDENSDRLTKMIDVADRILTSSDLRTIF